MSYAKRIVRHVESGKSLEVRVIFTWNRGDIDAPVMSASSGPKDYVKNDIWALFEANPEVSRIILVRGSGPPFLLLLDDEGWRDVRGDRAEIERDDYRSAGAGA